MATLPGWRAITGGWREPASGRRRRDTESSRSRHSRSSRAARNRPDRGRVSPAPADRLPSRPAPAPPAQGRPARRPARRGARPAARRPHREVLAGDRTRLILELKVRLGLHVRGNVCANRDHPQGRAGRGRELGREGERRLALRRGVEADREHAQVVGQRCAAVGSGGLGITARRDRDRGRSAGRTAAPRCRRAVPARFRERWVEPRTISPARSSLSTSSNRACQGELPLAARAPNRTEEPARAAVSSRLSSAVASASPWSPSVSTRAATSSPPTVGASSSPSTSASRPGSLAS